MLPIWDDATGVSIVAIVPSAAISSPSLDQCQISRRIRCTAYECGVCIDVFAHDETRCPQADLILAWAEEAVAVLSISELQMAFRQGILLCGTKFIQEKTRLIMSHSLREVDWHIELQESSSQARARKR
jgi:hypothetical protein